MSMLGFPYIATRSRGLLREYPDVDGMNLVRQPIEELVQDLSQRIFKAHQARIAEVSDGQN